MVLGRSVDPEIESFVVTTIDSFVTWDIIVFFHDWPGFAGDAATIAKHLGRTESEVAGSVSHLADLGVLRTTPTGGNDLYALAPDDDVSVQIDRFCLALEHRETRLALLSMLLRKGIR